MVEVQSLQQVKDLLAGADDLDRFQVRANLSKFLVPEPDRDELNYMKLQLKKC